MIYLLDFELQMANYWNLNPEYQREVKNDLKHWEGVLHRYEVANYVR
jgi:hypothetical protein